MKNTIKRMLGFVLLLSLVCNSSATVFASEDELDNILSMEDSVQNVKYSNYKKILSKISKEYGIEAWLEPIEWFIENGFPSEEEFAKQVESNCNILANTYSTDEPTTKPDSVSELLSTNAVKIYTWKDTQYKSSYGITITFTFGISVAQNPDTEKYFISQFNAYKPTLSGSGKGIVNSYSTTTTDGGRTRVTTVQMTLEKDGVNYSKKASAYVYCSTSSGSITIQGY